MMMSNNTWSRQGSATTTYSQQKRKWSSPQDRSYWRAELNVRSVPDWEKRFCSTVGQVPWAKLVETKKYMLSLYKSIADWNDSAGEDAFNEAKCRYWAEINGLQPEVSMRSPDMYIDVIDWDDCDVDPEVILDLERSKEPKPDDYRPLDHGDPVIIGLDSLPSYQSTCWGGTGWGDEFKDQDRELKNKDNVAENNKGHSPWESTRVDQSKIAWNKWERNKNYSSDPWKKNYGDDSRTMHYGGGYWHNNNNNNNSSRYKISRFHGNVDCARHQVGGWRTRRSVNVG